MNNSSESAMNRKFIFQDVISWILGIIVFFIGFFNLVLVHAVPGITFLLLSLLFAPRVNEWIKEKSGFSITLVVKITLGLVIIWFTLGVSDLGDMID